MTTMNPPQLEYCEYKGEEELPEISSMIAEQLSEPYSDFTYRYFLNMARPVSFTVYDRANNNEMIGCIIAKIDEENSLKKGYIGMLAVNPEYRGQKIGTYFGDDMKSIMGYDELQLRTGDIGSMCLICSLLS